MNASKPAAPPSRVPVALFLQPGPAKAKSIAEALGMSEAEVLAVLGWHAQRGNVSQRGDAWRLTSDGEDWLRVHGPVRSSKSAARIAEVIHAPDCEPAPKTKASSFSANTVRERLTAAGLWPFVETFANQHGVLPMALVGTERSKYLSSVRHALYAALLEYPGRDYSGPEVARLMGRRDHSTVYRGKTRHVERQQKTEKAA